MFTRLRRIRSHARQKRSRAKIVLFFLVLVVAAGAGLRFVPGAPFYPKAEESGPLAAAMPFHPTEITPESLGTEGFLSWAYLDLTTGQVAGSANMGETTDAESMVTAWIAADFLRRTAEIGDEPAEADLADLDTMIRDDDEAAAERIVAHVGGATESMGRMVAMCHLPDTEPAGESWRDTVISARDAALMGGCLADGRAAGAQWTPWILNAMRQVRGTGDFGIREAFPAGERASIAIKNGWMLREADGLWRANCLAISDTWVLAVLQRYPANDSAATDLAHVDAVCQQVVWRLTTPPEAAPSVS
jgi:hypothetical protein